MKRPAVMGSLIKRLLSGKLPYHLVPENKAKAIAKAKAKTGTPLPSIAEHVFVPPAHPSDSAPSSDMGVWLRSNKRLLAQQVSFLVPSTRQRVIEPLDVAVGHDDSVSTSIKHPSFASSSLDQGDVAQHGSVPSSKASHQICFTGWFNL